MSFRTHLGKKLQVGCLCLVMGTQANAENIGKVEAVPHTRLPSGDGEEFRGRMTAWDAPRMSALGKLETGAAPSARVPLNISSPFGWRNDPFKGGGRMHDGIDLPGKLGSRVRATGSGTVSYAGWVHGYGNLVQIDHPGHLMTRYAHLSRILVGRGMPVAQGDVIGEMGSTGRSTGSHLHYEVRSNGVPLNPVGFVGSMSANYDTRWAPETRVSPRWIGWGSTPDQNSLPVAQIR